MTPRDLHADFKLDAERRDVRHKVFQVAQLASGDDRWRCHVLNLSAHGALLHCETLPPGAGRLHLVMATLREDASVRWRHGDRVGIRFDSALTSEVLRRAIAGAVSLTRTALHRMQIA